MQTNLLKHLSAQPIVPVVTLQNIAHAVALAQALCRGGIHCIEVTLRSEVALDAIAQIRKAVPEMFVGAGTILNVADFQKAEQAGSQFVVSPGGTEALLQYAKQSKVAYLPGAATASEVMNLASQGFLLQKFFPAEAAGGVATLKALHGPMPLVQFCATGGISPSNAHSYLALPNIISVGASWISAPELMQKNDWAGVEKLAQAARKLAAATN